MYNSTKIRKNEIQGYSPQQFFNTGELMRFLIIFCHSEQREESVSL
jgi:hypothetical protein